MAFYSPDAAMHQRLAAALGRLTTAGGEALAAGLSITWLHYPESLLNPERDNPAGSSGRPMAAASHGRGACWQGERLRSPGELVQLPYLIACERWLQRGVLEEEPELRRALRAMIRQGSHDATSYVVDRLSGTTSGPALAEGAHQAWVAQRLLVNGWLASLGWPELEGCVAAQKTWQDGPYGRERQFLGAEQEHANRFSSDGLARLLEGVLAGTLISPPAAQRMRRLLAVQHPEGPADDSGCPEAEGLPLPPAAAGWHVWGKRGRGSNSHALALYGEGEGQDPVLLVLLAEPAEGASGEGPVAALVSELLGDEASAG